MLVLGICTLGGVSGLIGLIEGIIYLTKSDQEFDQTYVFGKKEWF
jgi:alpha-acetolactate decarboxylase